MLFVMAVDKAYKLIVAFSVYTNTQKWLSTSGGKDNLGCLHGLRFLSMCWVVLAHSFAMTMMQSNWNAIDLRNVRKQMNTNLKFQHSRHIFTPESSYLVDMFKIEDCSSHFFQICSCTDGTGR